MFHETKSEINHSIRRRKELVISISAANTISNFAHRNHSEERE